MGLNIGITNDYLLNSPNVASAVEKYILWAKARQGGSPGLKPSLDLDFARNKSLIDNVTGSNLVTFTRASSGTFVGSDGVLQTAATDVPRFDHNPTTGESLGLLVEEQRTNLLLRSEEFDNGWSIFGLSVTANQETAPNGLLAADLISIAGSGQGIWQFITCTPGLQYTASVYVKLGTLSDANYKIAVRDDTAGVFIASDITPTQTPSSTGWTRISYTVTAPAGCTTLRFYPFRNTTNVTGTMYLWGAQLEAGAFPTSYIPTTTATVTRSADVTSISGSNFSSWYRQDEGTVFTEAQTVELASSTKGLYGIGDSSLSFANRTKIDATFSVGLAGRATFSVNVNGSGQASLTNLYTQLPRVFAKIANSYKENDFGASTNGLAAVTDNSGQIPVVTSLSVGSLNSSWSGGASFLNGTIRRLTYWPARLPNSTLQTLTQ
jgi:hypothetical protein